MTDRDRKRISFDILILWLFIYAVSPMLGSMVTFDFFSEPDPFCRQTYPEVWGIFSSGNTFINPHF